MMNKKGLYIHIPFCRKICSYCDFAKRVSNQTFIERYLECLLKEFDLYSKKGFDFSTIKTIYIGGGTPSSLNLELLDKLFKKISSLVDVQLIEEYNFEINPEDLSKELIDLLASYNVNRVSIGIQTLNKDLLKLLNRDFDYLKFKENLKYLKTKIKYVNLDLMYAIPGQTVNDLEETIKEVISLNVDHLSVYSLILEEKTIFNYLVNNHKINLIDEDTEMEMVDKIHKLLFPIFQKYEVSNFSKKDCESKHNLLYWQNDEYLGIGLSSAGYLGNYRYVNTSSLKEYFSLVENEIFPIEELEELDLLDEKKYHIILGLRLIKGIDVESYLRRFKTNIFEDFPKLVEFIEQGFLGYLDNRIFIYENYFYIMNHLLEQII